MQCDNLVKDLPLNLPPVQLEHGPVLRSGRRHHQTCSKPYLHPGICQKYCSIDLVVLFVLVNLFVLRLGEHHFFSVFQPKALTNLHHLGNYFQEDVF